MNKTLPTILFLGNGRCFHTMDWFRSAREHSPSEPPVIITDLIDGESYEKLLEPTDRVERLTVLDSVLSTRQSRAGDLWRNLVKLAAFPCQVARLRAILRRYPCCVIHAHSMYYIVLAAFSGHKFVATPQGSELLVRPHRSRLYRTFARIGLSRASRVVVDSVAMQRSLDELFGLPANIIQNGIDIDSIAALRNDAARRNTSQAKTNIVSLRGFAPNYQIDRLLDARNRTARGTPLHFSYPFESREYKAAVSAHLLGQDHDLGRLGRLDYYRLLLSARLVISIPKSDSSPRSVYEAIFCGCLVAVTKAEWINHLPPCMADRVTVVDLTSDAWFVDALKFADARIGTPYVPSAESLEIFDQKKSYLKYFREIYPAATNRQSAPRRIPSQPAWRRPLRNCADPGEASPRTAGLANKSQ